jgi:hypothetical protein
MQSQRVNLRWQPLPLRFGSSDDERAYLDEAEAMRAVMTSEHCVAPRCSVTSLRGVLAAGSPIAVVDLAPEVGADGHERSPRERLEAMVRKGIVLSRDV